MIENVFLIILVQWRVIYGHRFMSVLQAWGEFTCILFKKNITSVLLLLKYDWFLQFNMCVDLVVYDRPGKVSRFTVIYYLLSTVFNVRFHLVTQISARNPLETASFLFSSLNWSEREVWDMFGILFLFHRDLRRILTDYGFLGFPIRKDFPLSGYKEILYNDSLKRLVYRAVELSQEFRVVRYTNLWLKEKNL